MEKPEKESKRGKKLYYYLSRLKPKEIKDFHAYLQSPLLGNSPQMARMLLTIQAQVLDQGGQVIDAELFQAEFFPDTPLDEGKRKYIRIRLVQLLGKLMDFVAFMDYKQDINAQHVHLLRTMYNRGWERYFEQTYQEIDAMPPVKEHGEYHMYRLRREIVRNDYLTSRKRDGKLTNLQETCKRIDELATFLYLKYSVAKEQLFATSRISIQFDLAEYSPPLHAANSLHRFPEARCYYNSLRYLQLLREDQYARAFPLMTEVLELLQMEVHFDRTEFLELAYLLQSTCEFLVRNGQSEFKQIIIDTLRGSVFTKSLESPDKIPVEVYTKSIGAMARIGEIDWAFSFLEQWKDRLTSDPEGINYALNKSLLALSKGEYDIVIELLYNRLHLIKIPTQTINARNYLCRAAWEKGDYVWLRSMLEAQRQYYLRLQGISRREKAIQLDYLDLFNKMALAKLGNPGKTMKKLVQIKERIETEKKTDSYFWLYRTLCRSIN